MGFQSSIKDVIASGGVTLFALILLSIYSIALVWERWRFYSASLDSLDQFLGRVRRILRESDLSEAVKLCGSYKGLASAVVMACLSGPSQRDDRKRSALRATERAVALLQARTTTLGTIASTAPFIGLFGTVVGVMRAFRDLAGAAGAGPGVVAIGISEALVCTATGLFVAIPAVVAYNYLNSRADEFAEEMGWISEEILEHLAEAAKTAR